MDTALFLLYKAAAELFEGKKVPEWLSSHPAIKGREEAPDKIFPSIGLDNFRVPVSLTDKSKKKTDDDFTPAHNAISDVSKALDQAMMVMAKAAEDHGDKALLDRSSAIREAVGIWLANVQHAGTSLLPDGRVALLSPTPMTIGSKNISLTGESIPKVYGKIGKLLEQQMKALGSSYRLMSYDSLPAVKVFNSSNMPVNREYWAVFSGSGEAAAWDLATMSMRGVNSCQRWGDGPNQYNCRIVGSIVSNYVGIIYLTSGSDYEGKGEKILRRSIVRYGIDTRSPDKSQAGIVILDKMYPEHSPEIAKVFLSALREKSHLPVLDFSKEGMPEEQEAFDGRYQIPNENLPGVEDSERSYQDLPFGTLDTDAWHRDDKETLDSNQKEQRGMRIATQVYEVLWDLMPLTYETPEDKQVAEYFRQQMNGILRKIKANKKILLGGREVIKNYFYQEAMKIQPSMEERFLNGFSDKAYEKLERWDQTFHRSLQALIGG